MNEEIRQISEELARAYEEISFLYEINRLLISSWDVEEICRIAMEKVREIIPAESGSIRILSDYYKLKDYYGWGPLKDLGDISLDQGMIGQVFNTGKPILVNNVPKTIYNRIKLLDYYSFLGVPLITPTRKSIGVIILANFTVGHDFFFADKSMLIALATQVTMAIENARYYHQAIEQSRIEGELRAAWRIQNSLLPAVIPNNYPLEIAAFYETAREVGGDYFNFFSLGDTNAEADPNNRMGFAMGDVMGKGIPAALLLEMVISSLKTCMTMGISSPGSLLKSINRSLYEDIDKMGTYFALWYGVFNFSQKKLTFASAGAAPFLHFPNKSTAAEVFLPLNPMVGTRIEDQFKESVLSLESGDLLVFFTDGVIEARSPHGEFFGLDRLKQIVRDARIKPVEEIKSLIYHQVKQFSGENLSDDLVLVVMRVK